jgi:hypothetical protein
MFVKTELPLFILKNASHANTVIGGPYAYLRESAEHPESENG